MSGLDCLINSPLADVHCVPVSYRQQSVVALSLNSFLLLVAATQLLSERFLSKKLGSLKIAFHRTVIPQIVGHIILASDTLTAEHAFAPAFTT